MEWVTVENGVTRSVGIEITVQLVYRTQGKPVGRLAKATKAYDPGTETILALEAAKTALADLIREATENWERTQAHKAARQPKGRKKATKKQMLLEDFIKEEQLGEQEQPATEKEEQPAERPDTMP